MLINMQQLAAEVQVKTMQLMPPPILLRTLRKRRIAPTKVESRTKTKTELSTSRTISVSTLRIKTPKKSRANLRYSMTVRQKNIANGASTMIVLRRITFSKADVKYTFLLGILKGKSHDNFVTDHLSLKEYNDTQDPDSRLSADEILELALNKLAQSVVKVSNAVRRQKHYMRNFLSLTGSVREFGKRLMELNKYFPYFPVDDPDSDGLTPHKGLPDDELNDILDRAKPLTWHLTMLESNLDVQSMSWDEILDYYKKLELSDAIKKAQDKSKSDSGGSNTNKCKRNKNSKDQSKSGKAKSQPSSARKEACKHCGKWH